MLSQCPACKKQIEVPESVLGKKVRCSGCQAVFVAEAQPPPPPEDEPIDMLEVLPEAPVPKRKQAAPAPKESPNAVDLGFDAAGPASDFSFVDTTKKANVAVRLRATGAANFLRYSVLFAALPTMLQASYPVIIAIMTEKLPTMAIGCGPLLIYAIVVVFLLVGAGCLEKLTSIGLAITGAIISVLFGLGALGTGLVMTLIAGIALFASGGAGGPMLIVAVITTLLTVIEGALLTIAGLRVMLVCFNGDVRAEFGNVD
jgi:predicted Zn finger-like uncharacterized protein